MNARKWLEELEVLVVAKVGKTPTMGVFTSTVLEITSQLLAERDKETEDLKRQLKAAKPAIDYYADYEFWKNDKR